jgi:diguanylate cyclase (GGDEF)-like protein
MATGPTSIANAAEGDGKAQTGWLTPKRVAVFAFLLLAVLQMASRVYTASTQAEAQGAMALALIEQQSAIGLKPGADTGLGADAVEQAIKPLPSILALDHCHLGQVCKPVYSRDASSPCAEGWSWQALCVDVSSRAQAGDSLQVAYDLRPTLKAAAIDVLITLSVMAGVLLIWQRAAQVLERERADAAPRGKVPEHDPLTGLLNRVAFEAALKRHNASKATKSTDTDGCLMYFDLDRFKLINDTHGHIAGDLVLKTVAERLRYTLPKGVLIGRLGGDEFAALLPDMGSKAHIETLCRVLIEQVSKPIQLEDVKDWVGLSIGAYMLKRGELSVGEMLHRADLAMYEAKRAGRGRLVFYDDSMEDAARSRAQVQADLKTAIEERQLFMVYQPQFDAHDSIRGVESMVRWRHPKRGLIPPEEFIPVAEQSGLIVPLGKMVIDLVCADLVSLRAQRLAIPYVSMDVSLRQLADQALVDDVQDALKRHGLSATDIEFEVTESTAMEGQVGKENATLKRLAAQHFRIAIDDFGTGYSSMGRLLDLKVDKLKIDGVFVAAIGKPNFNPALLELMISLATRLGVKSVAEGVETLEQVVWLRNAGCQMMQGDFYAKPMNHAQLVSWLKLQEGDNDFDDGVWAPTGTMEFADV